MADIEKVEPEQETLEGKEPAEYRREQNRNAGIPQGAGQRERRTDGRKRAK